MIDGRFELGTEVGSGGMAAVYQGADRASGRPVAIKLLRDLSEEELQRFRREAELLAGFSHGAIPGYLGHGTTPDGIPYLVEEWLDGPTLAEQLDLAGLTVDECVVMARQVADALAHVHRHGVVHRDVKPENVILLGGNPAQPKLIDFGIARVDETRGLTATGMMLGTLGYMAPEQARGERGIGPAADLFGLGCVLYESLTGTPAFSGSNDTAVWAKVLLLQPAPARTLNPEVPQPLGRLVSRLLEKDPRARPPDAAEVVAELATLAPSGGTARRQRRTTESPTVRLDSPAGGASEATRYVMHVGLPAADRPPDPARVSVVELIRQYGADTEPLADGSILGLFSGDAGEAAGRAARCAIAVDRLCVGAPIVVGQLSDREGRQDQEASMIIDWVAQVAQRLEFVSLWRTHVEGAAPSASILLDPATADRIGDRFRLAPVEAGFALLGELDPG